MDSALLQYHPLFETTDTFQQLIDHLNDYGDILDSDIRWLDSQIGDVNSLTTENINADPDGYHKNLVMAINEIDSDLYGGGGGNFADETLSVDKNILDATNSIFEIFDPYETSFRIVDRDFIVRVEGAGRDISLLSDEHVIISADHDSTGVGDVHISTGQLIDLQKHGESRIKYTFGEMGSTNYNKMYSNGIYEMHAKDSVIVKSDANAFSFNNVVDWRLESGKVYSTVHGDLYQSIDGDYTIDFTDPNIEHEFLLTNPHGQVAVDLTDSSNTLMSSLDFIIEAPSITFKADEMNQKTDAVRLFSPTTDEQWGGFTNEGGYMAIRSNDDSEFMRLVTEGTNIRVTKFNGSLELPPRPVDGSLSLEFDTINSRKMHDVLESLNRKIPRVYDRNGNLLNTLT